MGNVLTNELINGFVDRVEVESGVKVIRETIKVVDRVEPDMYKALTFEYVVDGTHEVQLFFVDSDELGNGGYEWSYGETIEDLVASFSGWLTVGYETT